jgi:DNA (cytosine-5)-methyltransferase 1
MCEKIYRVVSLFTGAMGLDIGFLSTGRFGTLACVEVEKVFCETMRRNIACGRLKEAPRVYEVDICELEPEQLLSDLNLGAGEVDLLVGGPPCQSFSTAGRRGTIQDPRGTLLWEFLRFVDAIRPKVFLMENVRGLLSAAIRHRPIAKRPEKGGPPLSADEEPGSVVRMFARELSELKGCAYHLDIYEVNAVNYGAPQIRERAIFIGNRYGANIDFPNPTHGPNHALHRDETQLELFEEEQLLPWSTLRDALTGLKDEHPVIMDFSPRKKSFLARVPPGSNWRSLPVDVQKQSMGRAWHAKGGRSGWWRRLTFDLPCPTLVTMPNHASTSLCHPTETRALSIREYARIQEFPDDWEFAGTTAEQYAQVGNAVPTRLGRIAGTVIAAALDDLRRRDWKPYTGNTEDPRITYLQSHVRTRSWFRDGETLVWDSADNGAAAAYQRPKTLRRTRELKR